MNKHLVIVCALPTVLFIGGGFLSYIGFKYKMVTDDRAMYDVGNMFMIGAVVIALQSLYSLYWG